MSSSNLFFFVFLPILLSTSPLVTAADDDKPTAYEVLQQYDFPVGILPKGVTGYELDRATGKFTVHFDKTCSFNIQGYQLRLEKIVLQDRDSITFEIDELVAKQSVTIKHMIEDILANRGPILLSKIPSNILVKVIDYCKCIFTQPPTGENNVD